MEKHEKLLNMLMDFNPLVRFTAVCSQDGEIEWNSKRDDVTNIISLDETKASIKRIAESWKARGEISKQGTGRGKNNFKRRFIARQRHPCGQCNSTTG